MRVEECSRQPSSSMPSNGRVPGDRPVVAARVARITRRASERSGGNLRARAGESETVLHVDGQRAAQRVQSEHGVGSRKQLHRRDRVLRQQVPVHDVGKGLVDPHAVLEHRQALRRAQQRRGGKAAKAHVRLEALPVGELTETLLALRFRNSATPPVRCRARSPDAERLHVRRHLLQRRAEAGQGRRADDLDVGIRDRCLGRRRCARRRGRAEDQRQRQEPRPAADRNQMARRRGISESPRPTAAYRPGFPRSSCW